MKQRFPRDPDYLQSIRGLHRLHELTLAGGVDGPEAEVLRAGLEQPWARLSDADRARITGLSEDLYSISDPQPSPLPLDRHAQLGLMEAIEASRIGAWDGALELLRHWGRHLDPAVLAYLRGRIWMDADDYATAAVFFGHASKLDPSDATNATLYLNALSRCDLAKAEEYARSVLAADQKHPAALVVQAIDVRYLFARESPPNGDRPLIEELIGRLDRVLNRLDNERRSAPNDATRRRAILLAALCHDRLGNRPDALVFYNRGIATEPDNDVLLVGRGILRYGIDPWSVNDFEEAVRLGSSLVWPYFFLAHHYLLTSRYQDSLGMIDKGLSIHASPVVKANLYEALAIAFAELGLPPQEVRQAFESALRLQPLHDRIRRNLGAFETSAGFQPPHPWKWQQPNDTTIQAVGHSEFASTVPA